MLLIDDVAIVLIFQGILPELGANLPDQFFDQPVFHPDIAEDIVGSHAGLSAVQELAEDDTPGCRRDVRSAVYDAGALSAKLQGHRRQVCGGLLHDEAAHRLTAGEKDVVEMLFQKCRIFRPSSGHHSHQGHRKISPDQALHETAGAG